MKRELCQWDIDYMAKQYARRKAMVRAERQKSAVAKLMRLKLPLPNGATLVLPGEKK